MSLFFHQQSYIALIILVLLYSFSIDTDDVTVVAFTTITTFVVTGRNSYSNKFFAISTTDTNHPRYTTALAMGGGFGSSGGGGGMGKKKANKKGTNSKNKSTSGGSTKLRPKTQWDRFDSFKKEKEFKVAVRSASPVVDSNVDNDDKWFEVGYVKSESNQYTEIAVARQRGLLAEHANRLDPLKFTSKTILEWAYYNDETEEWIVVDKNTIVADSEETNNNNIERKLGFEGTADPNTGYYCHYDQGKMVDRRSRSNSQRKSY